MARERPTLTEEALPIIGHQYALKLELQTIQARETESCRNKSTKQHLVQENSIEQHELSEDHSTLLHDLNEPQLIQQWETDVQSCHDSRAIIQQMDIFKNNILTFSMLPPYWLYDENLNGLEFMRLNPTTKKVINHIRLNNDLSITVSVD